MNLTNIHGVNVWHWAALEGTLKDIPKHLFTNDDLAKESNSGISAWRLAAIYNTLYQIPLRLITNKLLGMKNSKGSNVFNETGVFYINHIISEREIKLKRFVKNNPELERVIEYRDPRLVLIEVGNDFLVFKFNQITGQVTLSKDGAFLNNENYKTLANIVAFIENNYPNVEKSQTLPKNVLKLEPFVL